VTLTFDFLAENCRTGYSCQEEYSQNGAS